MVDTDVFHPEALQRGCVSKGQRIHCRLLIFRVCRSTVKNFLVDKELLSVFLGI